MIIDFRDFGLWKVDYFDTFPSSVHFESRNDWDSIRSSSGLIRDSGRGRPLARFPSGPGRRTRPVPMTESERARLRRDFGVTHSLSILISVRDRS